MIVGSEDSQFALMIWLVGFLALVVVYGCGSYRLHAIKQSATEPSSRIWKRFDACKHRLGLNQRIELWKSGFINTPVSFDLRKSFVVLPKDGIDELTEAELGHILLHELTHIRHRDLITNYYTIGPEVTAYTVNSDGTITLTVEALSTDLKMDCLFAHEVTICPLENGQFQYVGNRVTYQTEYGLPYCEPRLTWDVSD